MVDAVIAVRGGSSSKSRCAGALSPQDRAMLTQLMLEDMIDAAAKAPSVSRLWVVTPTPALAAIAGLRGARVIDQRGRGLNAAFALALAVVSAADPDAVIALLPGDLPLVQPSELETAIRLARSSAVVLSPATADGGTGAIVLQPGARPRLAFGPDSFARHQRGAATAGLSLAVFRAPGLGRDIDRPDDFAPLLKRGGGTASATFLRRPARLQKQVALGDGGSWGHGS
jgi:2-phospho-L-lactate/phosphoenolpyruvate guanylyltransferase